MAFRDNNQDSTTNEYFRNLPEYKSYEEIVTKKRRRAKIHRAVTLVVLLGVVLIAVLIVTFTQKYNEKNPGSLSEYNDPHSSPSSDTNDFALTTKPKPPGSGAIVVKDVRDVVSKVKPSVVGVVTESFQDYTTGSTGSGIILTDDGYIVTNNHVIESGNNISVTLDSGDTYSAFVIGKDAQTDIAVLKIEATNLPAAELGNSDGLVAGEAAVAIGNPMGMELQGTVTAGVISAVNRNIMVGNTSMNLVQTDAAINPGNSGGALINEFGQVIGVNSVKISVDNSEGLGFAIPINTVKPIVEELITNGYVSGRPLVGISARSISPMAAAFYGLPQGVLVNSIEPSSDIAKQGIATGDIIIGVDGVRISTIEEACALRDKYKAGASISISVYRNGEQLDIKAKLMEKAKLEDSYNF